MCRSDRKPEPRRQASSTRAPDARWEDFASESIWLCAATFVPYFFNIESARHFEADKAIGARILAIAALAIEGLRLLRGGSIDAFWHRSLVERIRRSPHRAAILTVVLLVVSTLLSTAFSVAPRVSLWGSYERRQGPRSCR